MINEPFPLVEISPEEIADEFEAWWAAGEADRSADRLRYGDVDSTVIETGRVDLRPLAATERNTP